MKKEFVVIALLAIVIIALGGVYWWQTAQKPENSNQNQQQTQGIQVDTPQKNAEVSSPLQITGTVNGDGWTGFEGQVGTVRLLDETGRELALGILNATTEWTQLPVSFKTTLVFQSDKEQQGTLVFRNENASGLPEKDRQLILPVKIAKVDTMELNVYFGNLSLSATSEQDECKRVFPVKRYVPKTEAVASAAIQELLKGPTEDEKNQGYYTSINSGVILKSMMIGLDTGTAYADFSQKLEEAVGGSCKVAAIRSQLDQTLLQFPTIKKTVISIDGRTEDILQP